MTFYANLHNHSTHADGKYTPAELAQHIAAEGYRAGALTDHDTATGYTEFKAECDRLGIECIFGVE
ncbi:MAG: PHP domain-containing protein, partial [Clostridia bacterium]|nr:PHP domain-containing protein [Clostridia bacterium]